jgi:hypothetical protein
MSKQLLNITEILGMFQSEGTDLPPGMVADLQNFFVDTEVGVAEGAKDYSAVKVGGSFSGISFEDTLGGGIVHDIVFFSPSHSMDIAGAEYKRVLVMLVNAGTFKLKFYGVADEGEFDLIYDVDKDHELGVSGEVGSLVEAGETLRITMDGVIKWFGYLEKHMIYRSGVPSISVNGWHSEDAIVSTTGMNVSIEESVQVIYEEEEDYEVLERSYTYSISPVYDYIQDGEMIFSKQLKTRNAPRITISLDTGSLANGGISRRLTGIKLWRKVGTANLVLADADMELVKHFGVAFDTNSEVQSTLFESPTGNNYDRARKLNHLAYYYEWNVNKLGSGSLGGKMTYDLPGRDDLKYHYRFPRFEYTIPLDTSEPNFQGQAGKTYFMSCDRKVPLEDFTDFDGVKVKMVDSMHRFETAREQTIGLTTTLTEIQQNVLWRIRLYEDCIVANLVYGSIINGSSLTAGLSDVTQPILSDISPFMITKNDIDFGAEYRIYEKHSDNSLEYLSNANVFPYRYPGYFDDIVEPYDTDPTLQQIVASPQGQMEENQHDGGTMTITGEYQHVVNFPGGVEIAENTAHIIRPPTETILFEPPSSWLFPIPATSSCTVFNDHYGKGDGNWGEAINNTSIPASTFDVSISSQELEIVSFDSTGAYTVDMMVTDILPDDVHSNRFYTEQVGLDKEFKVENYTSPIIFANRLFALDGKDLVWSKQFKYDQFHPENVQKLASEPKKFLKYKDTLVAFFENDIFVFLWSGVESTWKTNDSIDKIGTTLVDTIVPTDLGLFFTNQEGVFILKQPERTGKSSYFNKTRIDEPIKDMLNLKTALPSDLYAYFDPTRSRYVLHDNRNGKSYCFSAKKGWMPLANSAFNELTKSVAVHDGLQFGLCKSSGNTVLAKLRHDGEPLNEKVLETGWLFGNAKAELVLKKKWRTIYLNAVLPALTRETSQDEEVRVPLIDPPNGGRQGI